MTNVLANRASTFSKGSEFWSGDPDWYPAYVFQGRGAYVTGSDGQTYLDWVSGLGANLLGYPRNCEFDLTLANDWAERIMTAVRSGAAFSLPHVLELTVADHLAAILAERVPSWQHEQIGVRWVKTGSDACETAIRMARFCTRRNRIISIGYHGWHASFVSTTPPAHGVIPNQDVIAVPYGDLDAVAEAADDRCAAIIVEQPPQPVPDGYWTGLRNICDGASTMLIVDEVVTGLRYAIGGACERFGIQPDLICMGKALGNGLPIAAVVGLRSYFINSFARPDPVFVSSTTFGDAISLAGADAILRGWNDHAVNHIWQIGRALMDGLTACGWSVTGYPPVFLVNYASDAERAYAIARYRDHGILANRPWIPNLEHTAHNVDITLHAAEQIRTELDAGAALPDRLPEVLFRNR